MNTTTQYILDSLHHYAPFVLSIAGIMWCIQVINQLCFYKLNNFGIVPRNLVGLRGILLSPVLHADYTHLFSNSFFFIALSLLMCTYGLPYYLICSLSITLLSGILTWLFGRKAIHIGASSLIMGYWGCLLFNAYFYQSLLSIVMAVICMIQLGQLFYSLFPGEKKVSWEGHIFGFASGICTSFFYPTLLKIINETFRRIYL
ncbi:rhomboid family intramembrane serine protease [Facilibium subflavum]|uniref:rhomboid family intramembrane serine protease n=1 Tax=Facilibium subflavum TaxID=2219058 RepID=UPI000E65DFE5|nr:rhomboid family intramembrane serine protease [Facilibium subflavum]